MRDLFVNAVLGTGMDPEIPKRDIRVQGASFLMYKNPSSTYAAVTTNDRNEDVHVFEGGIIPDLTVEVLNCKGVCPELDGLIYRGADIPAGAMVAEFEKLKTSQMSPGEKQMEVYLALRDQFPGAFMTPAQYEARFGREKEAMSNAQSRKHRRQRNLPGPAPVPSTPPQGFSGQSNPATPPPPAAAPPVSVPTIRPLFSIMPPVEGGPLRTFRWDFKGTMNVPYLFAEYGGDHLLIFFDAREGRFQWFPPMPEQGDEEPVITIQIDNEQLTEPVWVPHGVLEFGETYCIPFILARPAGDEHG